MTNARTLPEATNRRAVLGAVLAVGTLATIPANAATDLRVDPELQTLIAAWHQARPRPEETSKAYWAAMKRAECPVPPALFATESDASQWPAAIVGSSYDKGDVTILRRLTTGSSRPRRPFDDRAREIIASWDNWQAEQETAKEREGVAEADALWSQAVKDYHGIGRQIGKFPAKTMADVIAKLLAAAPEIMVDDLDDDAHAAILAGAALDAQSIQALGKARS